jgi:hypothetical protein
MSEWLFTNTDEFYENAERKVIRDRNYANFEDPEAPYYGHSPNEELLQNVEVPGTQYTYKPMELIDPDPEVMEY